MKSKPANPTIAMSHLFLRTVPAALAFGFRTSLPATLCLSLAVLFLGGIPSLGAAVLTNCSETDLRVLLGQGGLVNVECDGTITLSNTLTVATNTTLDATGHRLILSGNGFVRVLYVATNVNFTAVNLMVTRGRAANGAGLYNDGGLVGLRNCQFQSNSASGVSLVVPRVARSAEGGAVFNAGTVTANGCVFQQNSTCGGHGGINNADGGMGNGGAIKNLGTLSVISCAFLGNSATGGGGAIGSGGPVNGGSGGTAGGGAIYSLGTLRIDESLFASNSAVGGNGGNGGNGQQGLWSSPNGANGGPGASAGGGALFSSGSSALVNCTLAWNEARGGYGGSGGAGSYQVTRTGIIYGSGGSGGNGGSGLGALEDITGTLRITNCTIAWNRSIYGDGGSGGASGGGGAVAGQPGASGTAYGAVYSGGTAMAANSVLADNAPGNATGSIGDAGHNLSSDDSCAFSGAGSRNNTPALLGPLTNNGGPTLTMAPLPSSPAIDGGDATSAPATDQRGIPRPVGGAADIGAVEFVSTAYLWVSRSAPSAFDLLATGVPNNSVVLQTSTDLLNWSSITTNFFPPNGTLLFRDPVAPGQKFYRLNLQ